MAGKKNEKTLSEEAMEAKAALAENKTRGRAAEALGISIVTLNARLARAGVAKGKGGRKAGSKRAA